MEGNWSMSKEKKENQKLLTSKEWFTIPEAQEY